MSIAVRTGLEPVTSCVTGRHSNQAELTHLISIFLNCGCKGMKFFPNHQENKRFLQKKLQKQCIMIRLTIKKPVFKLI